MSKEKQKQPPKTGERSARVATGIVAALFCVAVVTAVVAYLIIDHADKNARNEFVLEAGYKGQIDIDIFDIDDQYYISEVNPRFGGGYPHAYESGCDHMKMIINNLNGIANEKRIGAYDEGIYMMKYNEVKVRR